MQAINVTRIISAPIEDVFELLSDHAGYSAFEGIRDAKLLNEGDEEPNGDGAVRRIDLGAVWFEERISNFKRPYQFDYRIIRSRPPIEHESGCIRLQETREGTQVIWTSRFRIKIPILGAALSPLAARAGQKAFGSLLKAIDRRLTSKT